jgi:hypothetical protein
MFRGQRAAGGWQIQIDAETRGHGDVAKKSEVRDRKTEDRSQELGDREGGLRIDGMHRA